MNISTAVRGGLSPCLSFMKQLADLMLPDSCCICGKLADADRRFTQYDGFCREFNGKPSELHICGKCLSELAPNEPDRRWSFCLSDPYEDDPVPGLALYIPLGYEGAVKRALPAIKFGKKPMIAAFFGCLLGTFMKSDNIHADLVVPIPLSDARLKERGFNQASELARPAAVVLGIPFADDVLIRTRNTGRQTEIKDTTTRIANVSGAFVASEEWDLTGMTVIVVDDVATTGFTLHEAAVALYDAGAEKVLCAAFAGNRQIKNRDPF